ncbi:MAG: pseudouridine synthase [Bacteroidetes bacterium]|nr:pseudouridine synthase [Bacteroidota bacterium]
MSKFNKSPRPFADKKKPFKSKEGAFKKDRKSSRSSESGDSEGYKAKRTYTKSEGTGKSAGYKGKSSFGSSDKDSSFKKKRPYSKEGEDRGEKRPYKERSGEGFEKKAYPRKSDGEKRPYKERTSGSSEKKYAGKTGEYREKRSYEKKSEGETEEKSYKGRRSFTKNKDYRNSDTFKKKTGSFGEKKEFRGDFERKKTFVKNDKFSEKPDRFSKEKDFKEKKSFDRKPTRGRFEEDPEIKRVKHDEFEEGKSFSKGYKKEYSKEEKKPKKTAADDGLTRLNKYLSNAGIASRREADTLIKSGVVKVNGVPVTEMGYKIKQGDTVTYGDAAVKSERKVYLLLNKPKDYITTMDDPQERNTVMQLVSGACKERIYPVGRLDRNTTGLLLFTNDGELTKKLTHPKHDIKKVYHVSLNKSLKPEDFKAIVEGVELEDGVIKADDLAFVGEGKKEVGIEIHSGRNRVVRRLFEHLDYEVLKLDRVTFAGLTKKDLPRGKHRFLTAREISFLQMIG